MEYSKKTFYGLIFLLGIFFVLSLVSGTTTINSPSASSNLIACGEMQIFNVSITDGVNSENTINLTFYAMSTSTANNTWVIIGTNSTSLNLTKFDNMTMTSINISGALEDASDYIINVTAVNISNNVVLSADTNTGMIIDCTAPASATSLSPSDGSVDSDGDVTFSGTVTDSQTTSCTAEFVGIIPPGGSSQSMSYSSSSCSLSLTSLPEQTYTWFIRASDGLNTTDSSSSQVTIDVKSGGGGELPGEREVLFSGPAVGFITVVIIIVVIAILLKKK